MGPLKIGRKSMVNGVKFHPTYRGPITPLTTGCEAHLVALEREKYIYKLQAINLWVGRIIRIRYHPNQSHRIHVYMYGIFA